MKKILLLILISLVLIGCNNEKLFLLEYENNQYNLKQVEECPEIRSKKSIKESNFEDIKLKLINNKLIAYKEDVEFWQTDDEWNVDNFLIADADNDQEKEIIITVWKQGSFGTDLPLWVDKNDENIEHHLFLYDYNNGKISPKWHSSSLPRPIEKIAIYDINQDNRNELIVLEGNYNKFLCLSCFSRFRVMQWNEWVFENIWQTELEENINICL